MQNHQEKPATLEDIVFQNRNKSYGAYSLRIDYQNVIKKSLLIGISIFGLAVVTPMLWAKVDDRSPTVVDITPINPDIPKPPKDEIVPPVEKPPVEPEPEVLIAVQKFLAPEIVPDDHDTEVIKDQEELSKTEIQIGSEDKDGVVEPIPTEDPDAVKGKEVDMPVAVTTEEADKEYITVEQFPEFAGGRDALIRFLQKNLRYPTPAANAGVGGKVYMQFVVGQDGAIRNVDVLKGIGFGCDEEAQRVVKLMPHWSPGRQSGRAVSVKFTLPISFQLAE
jgi:periplasmic protein TonB